MTTQKQEKTAGKESRFYIIKTVNKAKTKIESKLGTVNQTYVKKTVESGREFITELKADPVKRIDDLIDDSKDAIKKAKSHRMETLHKKMDTTKKQVQEKMNKINQETRTVYKGIGNDAKLIVEDIVAMGKKNLDSIPMKNTIEKKIADSINAIPAKLNLPSKAEIDNLVAGIDRVSKKVDALSITYADA